MATIRDEIIAAIYEQESSSGKQDTRNANRSGARGPMQVTLDTFNLLKSKGMIPKDYDHANPEHTMQAGLRLIHSLADKYQDDPRKVAAAYYAGEKAVNKDGTINNYKDLRNPNFPDTNTYVDQVVGRMLRTSTGGAVQPHALRTERTAQVVQENQGPGSMVRQGRIDPVAPLKSVAITPAVPVLPGTEQPQAFKANLDHESAVAQARRDAEKRRQESSFGSKIHQSFFQETFTGALTKHALAPEFPTDPLYTLDTAKLNGLTEEEQGRMRDAVSLEHEKYISFDIMQRRHDTEEIDLDGPFVGFAARIIAGTPESIVGGLGVARALQLAKVGASQLALAGNRGGAIASLVGENIGGNLAMVAAQDAFDPYIGTADYAMAPIMGTLVTPFSLPGLGKSLRLGADQRALADNAQRILDGAATETVALRAKAVENLGAEADPAALRAEMQRLDAEQVRASIGRHTAELPEDRMLLDKETRDYIAGEDPSAPKTEAPSEPSGMAEPVTVGGKPVSPTEGKIKHDFPGVWKGDKEDQGRPLMSWWDDVNNQVEMDAGDGVTRTWSAKDLWEHWSGRDYSEYHTLRGHTGIKYSHMLNDGANLPPKAKELLEWAHSTFLKDRLLFVSEQTADPYAKVTLRGSAKSMAHKVDMLKVRFNESDWQRVLVHEIGHLVFNEGQRRLGPDLLRAAAKSHSDWLKEYRVSGHDPVQTALKRGTIDNFVVKMAMGVKTPEGMIATLQDVMSQVLTPNTRLVPNELTPAGARQAKYIGNFDEFGAEQFSKYAQAAAADLFGISEKSLPAAIKDYFTQVFKDMAALFQRAKADGLLAPEASMKDLFDAVRDLHATEQARVGINTIPGAAPTPAAGMALPTQGVIPDAAIAQTYGLDRMPQGTKQEKAEYKAVLNLYRRAIDPTAPWNDLRITARLSTLLNTSVFKGAQSTSATMLRSANPVTRMLAVELLESPSGAGGRRSNAAIAKYMHEQKYMGNVINDVQSAYGLWRNTQGGNIVGDVFNGKLKQQFDKLVASEIEARRTGGGTVEPGTPVAQAADSLQAAYERMRIGQVQGKTLGWAALPETSVGYMPHRMSPASMRNATNAQKKVFHNLLREQFQSIEGFDADFSRLLASRYMDAVERRALGGYEAHAGVHQVGAADMVEDALNAMGMTQDEVRATMQRYMRGAAGHTKQRLQLDLNRVYDLEDGTTVRLLDMFETDQLKLVRAQARRVSGETALIRHGIMGKPGLKLMKRAMEFGGDNGKATLAEHNAFDQVAAEFLGEPFGSHGGKWLDRAMQANSLARLGGMGFTQFAESINMAAQLGVGRALASIGSLNRLRSEAAALARGEVVENPWLKSLEQFGGAEFGTANRKMVFPFDNPELQYQTFGQDTSNAADRLLRSGVHLQGKLSLWQALHGAQQRGAAEQIVKKSMEYIQLGKNDIHLDDMGIGPGLRERIRADLVNIAEFENGRLVNLDVTRSRDLAAMDEYVQAVHRGSSQIIQGTFIGETGAWAHDGLMKVVTQFRTFSLTSIEKQWGRQVGIHGGGLGGHAAALGILIGAMSFAAPIYMARVYAQSVGRKDQEAYLEKNLSWNMIARATMNYVALTGLAGDFVDALAAVSGKQTTGARTGVAKDFVGNVVAPSMGLADDLWRGVQNTKEGTDPHDLIKNLPFARLPFLIPAINALD